MKKQFITTLILLYSLTTLAQIKFEKGYFISNDGTKTECLIKNIDWENNPSRITFKLNENSIPKEITINEIEEFGIDDISKYERHTVSIDVSSQNLISLEKKVSPTFEEMQLLLKVLIVVVIEDHQDLGNQTRMGYLLKELFMTPFSFRSLI